MSVKVQVLDEKGLPVFCTVAAVRTSDQTILALYDTDSEGVANIAEAGTWYPRPMVSPNYKSRIRMIILNDQNAPCYDYVVSSSGGGTHKFLYTTGGVTGAWDAAVAASVGGNPKTIWLCDSQTLPASLSLNSMDDSRIAIHAAEAHDPSGATPATASKIRIVAPTNEPIFKATAGAAGENHIELRNIATSTGTSDAVIEFAGGNGSLEVLEMTNCDLTGGDVLLISTNTSVVARLRMDRCAGSISHVYNHTGAGGSGPDHIEIIDSRDLTVSSGLWVGTPERVNIQGGRLLCGAATDFNSSTVNIQVHGISIAAPSTAPIFTSGASTVGIQNISLTNIVVQSRGSTSALCNFGSGTSGGNNNRRLLIDSCFGYVLSGGTPSGATFVTVDTDWLDVRIGILHAPQWGTTYTGPTSGVGEDHGFLTGLTDDDHAQYALLLGRSGGQTLIGGTATGNNLTLRSNSFATPGDGSLLFEDANFGVGIVSSNPRIFFDTAADRLSYDRANNRYSLIIGNAEVNRQTASGELLLGYARFGSLTAPTNQTAGDVTGVRFFINDDSNFKLAFNGSDPEITFDASDALKYVRSTNVLEVPGVQWKATASGTYRFQKGGTVGNQTVEWDFDTTTTDPSFRIFRNTNTSGIPSVTVYKGNNTTTKMFEVRCDLERVQFFVAGLFSSYTDYAEIAAPSTPATGFVRVYAKSDGNMYQKDDAGTETNLASGGGGGGSGHTIRENDVDQTARTGLNFVDTDAGAGLIVDDAGNNETEVHLDLYTLKSVLTTRGDLYRRNATTVERLPVASDRKAVMFDGTDSSYQYVIETGVYASRPAASTANVGRLYMATDRQNTLYRCKDNTTWEIVNPRRIRLVWYIDGRLRADTATRQGAVMRLPEDMGPWKPIQAEGTVRVTSAGAAVVCQFETGASDTPATDVFSGGNEISISAGSTTDEAATFAATSYAAGNYFELLIDQVGSTAGSEGEDLTVLFELEQTDG